MRFSSLRWTRRVLLVASALLALGRVSAHEFPGAKWESVHSNDVGMRREPLIQARDYALSSGGSGLVTRHGKVVLSWGDTKKTYDLKSTSKSIGVTALGLAIADGKLRLNDQARDHHPILGMQPEKDRRIDWLNEITIIHLATQTAGFAKPGGYEPLLFRPGTKWHYSDCGPNWLAECVTRVYQRDVEELLFERVFTPIGITNNDLRWRSHAYRPKQLDGVMSREFGSGVHANVEAMARIGYLYLRRGRWRDQQLVPADFIDRARTTVPQVVGLPEHPATGTNGAQWSDRYGNASDHYGLLWWNNADGTLENVPRDAYWSWGLYDSLIVVIPSLDIVAARVGKSWNRDQRAGHYDVLKPFLEPIVLAVNDVKSEAQSLAPYPPSQVIKQVKWAPADSIIRLAKGSDNWPITWGDDDALYTAYGDGWGFKPMVKGKLSLGLAKVLGDPTDPRGINIRSITAEQIGQGPHGKKASGMLMVDGTLYMFVRNASNSQLAWSRDRGATWEWAAWKFAASFGCPTLLNFGRDYAGARDEFVYVYSADSDSAYDPADQMVLARVPTQHLRIRERYEFLRSVDARGKPTWTSEIDERGAVFSHPGRCYRGGVTYNAGLKRYLWCQILPESTDSRGPRFEGGFGIYDAPEPWGPWTTVFFTQHWDVGPGETSSLPPKWISADGETMNLVFSGDDCFSVRQCVLNVRAE